MLSSDFIKKTAFNRVKSALLLFVVSVLTFADALKGENVLYSIALCTTPALGYALQYLEDAADNHSSFLYYASITAVVCSCFCLVVGVGR